MSKYLTNEIFTHWIWNGTNGTESVIGICIECSFELRNQFHTCSI